MLDRWSSSFISEKVKQCLSFARLYLKTDEMAKFFQTTPDIPDLELRERGKFQVHFSYGEKYLIGPILPKKVECRLVGPWPHHQKSSTAFTTAQTGRQDL